MPSLPWPTTGVELRMFVRPPRGTGRPVGGGFPYRGKLFLSLDPTTGAPVVGIRYGAAGINGASPVTYTPQSATIAPFTINTGSDVWSFNAAVLINPGSKYYFLNQSMRINGVRFTVAGIGDVVGNSLGTAMTVTQAGVSVGTLSFSANGTVTFFPIGSQQGIPVTVSSDDLITWTAGNKTFSGFPTLLGANPLTGGYVGIVVGGPKDELDWEASGQGPIPDTSIPSA